MAEREELILNPVPLDERTSWRAPLFNILGCNVAISELMVGGGLIAGLALRDMIIVSVLGNLLLVLILSIQGYIGHKEGLNTYVLAQAAFGKQGGQTIISLLLGITSFGWFGIQAGVAGLSMQKIFPSVNLTTAVVVLGLLMMVFAVMGFRTMAFFNYIAVPPLVLLMVWGVWKVLVNGDAALLWSYTPATPISIVEGLNSVIGLIIVGAVISPDYLRYTRRVRDIFYVGIVGFAFISVFQQVAAGVIAMNAPSWDITEVLAKQGFHTMAFLILLLAAWSTNLSNAYSGGLALKSLLPQYSRVTLTLCAGLVGTAIAASGIIFRFLDFLSFLSMLVPSIAGVMWADYYVFRKRQLVIEEGIRWSAVMAWLMGSVASWISSRYALGLPPMNGIIVAAVFFLLLNRRKNHCSEEAH